MGGGALRQFPSSRWLILTMRVRNDGRHFVVREASKLRSSCVLCRFSRMFKRRYEHGYERYQPTGANPCYALDI
jgi:hypothetical protein